MDNERYDRCLTIRKAKTQFIKKTHVGNFVIDIDGT